MGKVSHSLVYLKEKERSKRRGDIGSGALLMCTSVKITLTFLVFSLRMPNDSQDFFIPENPFCPFSQSTMSYSKDKVCFFKYQVIFPFLLVKHL